MKKEYLGACQLPHELEKALDELAKVAMRCGFTTCDPRIYCGKVETLFLASGFGEQKHLEPNAGSWAEYEWKETEDDQQSR